MTWLPETTRYDGMTYRRFGRSGLKLPALSLGLWHNFGDTSPFETGRAMIRRAFDLGITHFDLANNYGPPPGSAEENFGRVLTADLSAHRDELILSTKAGYLMWPGPYGEWGSRKYLLASLDQSLRRMEVDYVDIFYSHQFDPETPLEETMGALDHAVRSGKALYAGISSCPSPAGPVPSRQPQEPGACPSTTTRNPPSGGRSPSPGRRKPSAYRRPPVVWVAHQTRSGAIFAAASSLPARETTGS